MMDEKPLSFIERRLMWLEDFKTTVEPIDSRVLVAFNGLKEYGLLLVRNMFVLNAGALIAAPAYATAIKEKSQLLGILLLPITLYVVGIFAIFSGVSAYYNFTRGAESGLIERNLEAHKLNNLHFPATENEIIEQRKNDQKLVEEALAKSNKKISFWYRIAHTCGWLCFLCFVSGSVVFMWKLGS
jgi:hypothetical protein